MVITELPHGVTTEALITSIEEAVKKKKIPIRNIDDFTSEKVEIELTLSQGSDQEKQLKLSMHLRNVKLQLQVALYVLKTIVL